MFKHQGIWLPDGEKHFPDWMTKNGEIVDGRGTYQMKKIRASLAACKSFRTAVDVGAHVGLWSMHLINRFDRLVAFEPMEVFRRCWIANIEGLAKARAVWNTQLHSYALGNSSGKVRMAYNPADSGGTHVAAESTSGDVELRTLDYFELEDVDFIKIDCEGYEHHVVAGASETILKSRPTIIVEQKPHKLEPNFGLKGTPAVDLLKSLGYRTSIEIGGDYIMVPA